MMMARYWLAGLALALLVGPFGAAAQAMGLDALHEQARVGNKVCMTEHEHYGEGTMPTRRPAQGAAIRARPDFTSFAYGRTWGGYRLAEGTRMECSQTGTAWPCTAYAPTCRPAHSGTLRRR